jgi:hypothetical protein
VGIGLRSTLVGDGVILPCMIYGSLGVFVCMFKALDRF